MGMLEDFSEDRDRVNTVEVPDKKRGNKGGAKDDKGDASRPELIAAFLNSVRQENLVYRLEQGEVLAQLTSTVQDKSVDSAHNQNSVFVNTLQMLNYFWHGGIAAPILP